MCMLFSHIMHNTYTTESFSHEPANHMAGLLFNSVQLLNSLLVCVKTRKRQFYSNNEQNCRFIFLISSI
mgnify:CR=1 FL=1